MRSTATGSATTRSGGAAFRSASSVMAPLELVRVGAELADVVDELADDGGDPVVLADLDLDRQDPLRLDREPLEGLLDVDEAFGGERRALDEVALIVVARLAAHQHDPVDARREGVGDDGDVERTEAAQRHHPHGHVAPQPGDAG